MPQFNLTTASGRELRQLLDTSRNRGDAAQSYKILQEMAARRDGTRGGPKRRGAEPRVIDLDLGDPLDRAEDDVPPMPHWTPPVGAAAPPAEPELEPARVAEPTSETLDLRLGPADLEGVRAPGRPRSRAGAGAVFGAALVFALGGGAGWFARDALAPLAAPTARPVEVAAVAPPLVVEPEPAPAAAIAPAPDALPDVLPLEVAVEPEPEPTAEVEAAAVEPPAPGPVETAEAGACAKASTPADRAICDDPALSRLQADLREAYARALAAHEDRALLRQRQLAWRDARSPVTDPRRLAALYEQRIRKLDAATAEAARRPRPATGQATARD